LREELWLLEIDEPSLKAIISAIDETLSLINEKKDIRIVASSLLNVGNKVRAMSEIKETPDNGFVSYVFFVLAGTISAAVRNQEDEWFELNKELCSQCLDHIKNLLQGMKTGLSSKSFEETISALKTSVFAIMQAISRMSD
jgi:hypothetical protein